MTNPQKTYQERISKLKLEIQQMKKYDVLLSILKLFIVVLGIYSGILFFGAFSKKYFFLFLSMVGIFVLISVFHERLLHIIRRKNLSCQINTREIEAIKNIFIDVANGESYLDPEHPYHGDLDIFGIHSLFQFFNRTTTFMGRDKLAEWLGKSPGIDSVIQRQEAVRELSQRLDFRQGLIFESGDVHESLAHVDPIEGLIREPALLTSRRFLKFFIFFFPLITIGSLVWALSGHPLFLFLGCFVAQFILNVIYFKRVDRIFKKASRHYKIIRAYARMMRLIEGEVFESPLLNKLRDGMSGGGEVASRKIEQLSRILQWFDLRLSSIHFLINNIFFWDLHCVLSLEKWKNQVSRMVPVWLDIVGEFEVLSSVANTHFNHPSWVFPEFEKNDFALEADTLGHPLIHSSERVHNSVAMVRKEQVKIITGPNMAGKSTFLRTVGVGWVMALTGAPVCAKKFRMSPYPICTSMKVSDSLDKKMSLFYSELNRLKLILEILGADGKVFFLIDEMLKGTNALDRHEGSKALLKQLIHRGARGILATHDVELTRCHQTFPQEVKNFHFDGYIEGDKLTFDYLLKPGVCESFNALALMKKMGIDIPG